MDILRGEGVKVRVIILKINRGGVGARVFFRLSVIADSEIVALKSSYRLCQLSD
jgi:hypothetical protein